jgi:hypothetical protein
VCIIMLLEAVESETSPSQGEYNVLLLMGVGWLAREDKLGFVQERGVLKLSLQTASAPR